MEYISWVVQHGATEKIERCCRANLPRSLVLMLAPLDIAKLLIDDCPAYTLLLDWRSLKDEDKFESRR